MTRPSIVEQAYAVVASTGTRGATYKEVLASGDFDGVGHGSASGALSRLHREGNLLRLKEKREKCAVYVQPAFLEGREHEPHRPIAQETRESMEEGPWAMLARITACECDCTCGARTPRIVEDDDEF